MSTRHTSQRAQATNNRRLNATRNLPNTSYGFLLSGNLLPHKTRYYHISTIIVTDPTTLPLLQEDSNYITSRTIFLPIASRVEGELTGSKRDKINISA